MTRYMDFHDGFVGATQDQLAAAHSAQLAIQDEEGVRFEHTWLDPEAGRIFCLSTAPSMESVRRIHERAGRPAAEIYELRSEV